MAASSVINVTIVLSGENAQTVKERYLSAQGGRAQAEQLALLMDKLSSGGAFGKIFVNSDAGDGTAATGSIACTQASVVDGTDVVTIGEAVFSAVATPSTNPGSGEFAKGASDTACGDNLAAAINAHPKLKGLLTAANVTGTITLTLVDKGIHGNGVRMTEVGNGFALTQIASGAQGTASKKSRAFRFGMA